VNRLAKWVACFASTKGGRILLGVDDQGGLVGLNEPYTDSPEGKEAFQRLIRSQVLTQVKPPILPIVDLIRDKESGRMVGMIVVAKGSKPPYYYQNTPYVRDCEECRPANPDEVEEMILARTERRDKRRAPERR
jgi:predicted HTH transcriptional regulator